MKNTGDTDRLNIALPKQTSVALEAIIPNRGKSSFITHAIEEDLACDRWEAAYKKLQELPPTLMHITDPVQWVEQLRREDE